MSEFLSVKFAAKYLGISPTQVYRLIEKNRHFPVRNQNGKNVFLIEELDKWLTNKKRLATIKKYPRRD